MTAQVLEALTAALDQLTTPVALCAPDRIPHCNAAFADLLRNSPSRIAQTPLEDHPALAALGQLARNCRLADEPIIERDLLLPIDHRPVSVAATVSPVAGAGDIVLIELTPIDWYVERDSIARQVQQQAAARQLARGLAHEIRNALGGMRGAAQLLGREPLAAQGQRCLEVISDEISRLNSLVTRVVDSAMPTDRQPASVARILERAREAVGAEHGTSVRIERDYDPSIPELELDGHRLQDAVINLLLNAIQAGATTVTLRTRIEHGRRLGATRHDTVIRIDVRDNGSGVDADLVDLMFYPLVTGRPGGTGLGLSLAQSVATEHGGLIVYHPLNPGSCFTLLLPLNDS